MTLPIALTLLTQASIAGADVAPAALPPAVTARSCRAAAGALDGSGSSLPVAVDGRKLKAFWQIAALRRNAPPGQIIVIDGGDFSRQKVGAIDLSAICFRGTRLTDTIWTETRGLGIGFIDADLTGARFERVIFDNILFRNATLTNVTAPDARFAFGQLDGGWTSSIAGLNLDGAQLIGFRFICGVTATDGCAFDRKQMSLRGTNLSGANLATFSFWDTSFENAILNQTEIAIDQVTRFSPDNVKGPVIVRFGRSTISVPQSIFPALRKALANTGTDVCEAPADPIVKLACSAPSGELIRLHKDIQLLEAKGATASLLSEEPKAHANALEKCVKIEGAAGQDCLRTAFTTWRGKLLTAMQKLQPLERNSRALYISNDTAHLSVATEAPVVTPLVVASASSMILAKIDEKGRTIDVRGSAIDGSGKRCVVADTMVRGKSASGLSIRIWSGGAEFTKQPTAIAALQTGDCNVSVTSGPMVRIPISDTDFDRLWKSVSTG